MIEKNVYYPYYTPDEMMLIGVYNEDANDNFYGVKASVDNSKWFKNYTETYEPNSKWYNLVSDMFAIYKSTPTLENKQSVLELGWNPEINLFNEKILYEVSSITKNSLINKEDIKMINFLSESINDGTDVFAEPTSNGEVMDVDDDRDIDYDEDKNPETDDYI